MCGSVRRQNGHSITRICPLCGEGGVTLGVARWAIWVPTVFDTIFRVLKLEAPASVEASSTDRYEETYPLASIVRYNFPARGICHR